MANKDFLFRAKADTRNYDANIAKARQQLDSFAKANLSTGGVMKVWGYGYECINRANIVLGRAEAFASRNGAFRSILDGAGMGLGFTIALTLKRGAFSSRSRLTATMPCG